MQCNDSIAQSVRDGVPLSCPVIDIHTHLGQRSSEYYSLPGSDRAKIIGSMDRFGVDHAVTFAISTTTDAAGGNQAQYDLCRAQPERFSPLTMLHAAFEKDWEPLLAQGHDNGSRGIKLISRYQGRDEETIDWTGAFDFARHKKWIVLHHNWGSPDRLARWAQAYPELVFIVGHAKLTCRDVVCAFDNVYQCTSAAFTVSHFASTQSLFDEFPAEKLLFGSDAVDLEWGTGIGPIACAKASEADKRKVLGENALQIMRRLQWPQAVRIMDKWSG